jgi:hypothetical protein
MQQLVLRLPEDLRPRRHQNGDALTIFAMSLVSFAMATSLSFKYPLILEVQQRVDTIRALEIHIATSSAVTAARPPSGDRFFSSKGQTAVTSASRNNLYSRPINKQVSVL